MFSKFDYNTVEEPNTFIVQKITQYDKMMVQIISSGFRNLGDLARSGWLKTVDSDALLQAKMETKNGEYQGILASSAWLTSLPLRQKHPGLPNCASRYGNIGKFLTHPNTKLWPGLWNILNKTHYESSISSDALPIFLPTYCMMRDSWCIVGN